MMVTIRELLGSAPPKSISKSISTKPKKSDDFIESAIIILGKNCPNCKELVESSIFKEFYKAARDRILIAFDEEGYLYGADYSNLTDLLERRVGISTPSVVVREDGKLCALQKGGPKELTQEEIEEMSPEKSQKQNLKPAQEPVFWQNKNS